MEIYHCYARSDSYKESGFTDQFDMFFVTGKSQNGYMIASVDGEEYDTAKFEFREDDFDEVDIREFLHEFSPRLAARTDALVRKALLTNRGVDSTSGLSTEAIEKIIQASTDPAERIHRYSEDHPELMEGKLVGRDRQGDKIG